LTVAVSEVSNRSRPVTSICDYERVSLMLG